jgi:Short C-terminal domain
MPGLLRGMARTAVVAGTATAVSNRVSRRQGERWAAQDPRQGYAEPPPPAPAAAEAGGADRVQQLKDLAALKEQGVLNEEEFAAEKARILGR